jgi:hypothetical protein
MNTNKLFTSNPLDFCFDEKSYYGSEDYPWIFFVAWAWCCARGTSFKLVSPTEFWEGEECCQVVDGRIFSSERQIGEVVLPKEWFLPGYQCTEGDNLAVVFNGSGTGRNHLILTNERDYFPIENCLGHVMPNGLNYELVLKTPA